MACIACEEVPKRINNIYRDEELKEKFENITGIAVSFENCRTNRFTNFHKIKILDLPKFIPLRSMLSYIKSIICI